MYSCPESLRKEATRFASYTFDPSLVMQRLFVCSVIASLVLTPLKPVESPFVLDVWSRFGIVITILDCPTGAGGLCNEVTPELEDIHTLQAHSSFRCVNC